MYRPRLAPKHLIFGLRRRSLQIMYCTAHRADLELYFVR